MRVIIVFRELDGARYGSLAALQPIIEIGELTAGVFTRDTTHNSDINDPFDVVSSYEAAGNSSYNFGPAITPTARFVSGVAVFTNMGFVRDFITNPNADIIEAATIGFNYPGIQIISSAPFNISNATKVVVKSTIQPSLFANRKVSIPIVVEVQDASSNPVLLAGVTITLTGTNTTLTGTLSGVTNASGVVTFSNVIPSNGTACDMAAAIVVSSLGLTPFTYNTVILQKEIIKPRRSEVTGAVPLASELDTYEMAINLTDKKIFAKKSDGSVVVVAGDPPDMTNANTAYTERRQWDGGSTNLNATTAKVSLGLVPGVDVQGYDADLQAISVLASGTGLLKKTGSAWSLDSSVYLTGSSTLNATTFNSQPPSYYLNYNNLTNKPSLSGGDASTLNSQPASYYLNYNNLTNKPTSITTVNATAPLVSVTTSGNTVLSIPLATTTDAGYMSVAQATALNTVTASTTQNRFYASPATAAGTPTFRNILASDIPILNQDTNGKSSTVTTNANLTGPITSAGNATSIASQTGTGSKFVVDTSPTLVTPTIGAATATTVNKITITQPATKATLTIQDGFTLTVPGTGSISGTNTGDNATNIQYSGLVSNATHTGDAIGATALTVVRINGVALSGLATGILKNTTTTGVPSIAVAADFPILNQDTTGNAATSTRTTTNANLTGIVTSVGNATSIANGAIGNTLLANTAVANLSGSNSGDNAVNSLYSGILSNVVHIGDVTDTSGVLKVIKINNVLLSGLATGILKNTTTTGIPSIAVAPDFPILNQNTVGTAAGLSTTLAVASGGTGQTTANGAINALLPSQSNNSGKYLISNGTNSSWGAVSSGTTIPSASMQMFAGAITQTVSAGTVTTTAPAGWLLANGDAVSRTTYSALLTAIGTTYGTGDGSTTFNLPDMRGRVAAGVGTGSGLTARTLGGTVGTENETLLASQIPAHVHPNSVGSTAGGTNQATAGVNGSLAHAHNLNESVGRMALGWAGSGGSYAGGVVGNQPQAGAGLYATSSGALDHTHNLFINNANNTGGGGSHNNMQPTIGINYIIKI